MIASMVSWSYPVLPSRKCEKKARAGATQTDLISYSKQCLQATRGDSNRWFDNNVFELVAV